LESTRAALIIDVHAHYYPDFYLKELRAASSPFDVRRNEETGFESFLQEGGLAMGLPPGDPSIDARILAMDAAGIDIQVLSMAGPSLTFLGPPAAAQLTAAINDCLLDICSRSGGRFLMFASVELTDVASGTDELRRLAANPEVVGVILHTNVNGRRFGDQSLAPFWKELDRLALPVFVHPITPVDEEIAGWGSLALHLGFPQETAKLIASMHFARLFDQYPSINWIFCHLGGGIHSVWDRFLKSGQRAGLWQPPDLSFDEVSRRIFYDCVSGHPPAIRLTYDTVGPAQMVFGSDCPHVPIDGSLNALRSVRLPGDEEQMILGENAKRFLRSEGSPS
jgi:aminocarboxymuconate-semialdehyde decarboxylase